MAALLCEFPEVLSSWKFPSVLSSCRVMTLPTGQAWPQPSRQPRFVPQLPLFCLPCPAATSRQSHSQNSLCTGRLLGLFPRLLTKPLMPIL